MKGVLVDRKQRVLVSLDGELTDISNVVNRYTMGGSKVIPMATTDAIYIGSELPFNHRYIEVDEANLFASSFSAHLWNQSAWEELSDVVDQTAEEGVTLAASGKLSFEPNVDKPGWARVYKSRDIPALINGPQILDLFWMRLTVSDNISTTTSVAYIGQKFCEGQDLFDIYPDLNRTNLMTAFKTGKTDWNEQIIIASELIADDLRQRRLIVRREQIMDTSLLRQACVHKTAEIIYRGLGNGHLDNRILAGKDYKQAMSKDFFEVDLTGDGRATSLEKNWSSSFGTR